MKILAVKIRTFRYTTIRLHVDAPQNDDQQQAHLKFEIHTWTATEIERVGKKSLNVVDLCFELIVLYYLDKFAFGKENKMVSIL